MISEGQFTSLPVFEWEERYLKRGRRYRVTKAFSDDGGVRHPVGEEWTFLGSTFSRFDDLHILGIKMPSGQVAQLPLCTDRDRQGEVVAHFDQYVALV